MIRELILKEPFVQAGQQREADYLGMYVFLGSEIMLFGGLFAALSAYRLTHPQAVVEAAMHLKIWLGTANTAILLTSSLFVALSTSCMKQGARRWAGAWLGLAAMLGVGFLAIKGIEYRQEYLEGLMPVAGHQAALRGTPAALFIDLYFIATALHAVHLSIGIVLIGGLAVLLARRRPHARPTPITVEMAGLYWHLVDVVWIFLFPLLYLPRR